ncbi:MAG: hypothetical protein VW557_11060 [Rhodospirillaceae bacterium]|jgi:hypothetical protein
MSEKPEVDRGDAGPKQVGGELVIPVAAILFSIYYFWTIQDIPWEAQVSALLVGSVLILLCLGFIIRTFLQKSRGEVSLQFSQLLEPIAFIPKRLTLLGLTLGYILVIPYAGFTLTTFAFLTAGMLTLSNGKKAGFILFLSALLSIGGYLLFIAAFKTRFPMGPIESALKGIL